MTDINPPCSCGKRAYYSYEEAVETAEHQMNENDAPALDVYRCPDNDYVWHLTRLLDDDH
ncbi:hypothetical protein ACFL26_02030 [Patescibacteria group bacterium]